MNIETEHSKEKLLADIEKLIAYGREEPTFEFLKLFCKTFRINYNWINEDKGYPFDIKYDYESPIDYLKDIKKLNPEKIYFIQNKSKTAETFIMLKFSDWYYMVGTKSWHMSNNVGATGKREIYDFYQLIKKLKDSKFSLKCQGIKLENREFYNILMGKSFPASCLTIENNNWWNDFTDITHYYPISDKYQEMYGKSFIEAQNIVKSEIKKLIYV